MPEVNVAYARQQLDRWLEALEAVTNGQSYSIGGRTLTRLDTEQIRTEIDRWHHSLQALEARERGEVRPLGAKAAFPTPGSGKGPHGLYGQDTWSRTP